MKMVMDWRHWAGIGLIAVTAGSAPALAQLAPAPGAATGRTAKSAAAATRDMVAAANPLAAQAGRRDPGRRRQRRRRGDRRPARAQPRRAAELRHRRRRLPAPLRPRPAPDDRLDGRETAPAAAKPERFLGPDGKPLKFYDAVVGGRSVGVPGTVRLLEDAHKRCGQPALGAACSSRRSALAEDGFAISPRLNGLLSQEQYLSRDALARAYFYEADGTREGGRDDAQEPGLRRNPARPSPRRERTPSTPGEIAAGHRRHRDRPRRAIPAT